MLLSLTACVLAYCSRQDVITAEFLDGSRQLGQVRHSNTGNLEIRLNNRLIAFQSLASVMFKNETFPRVDCLVVHRIRFGQAQFISGQLLGIDDRTVRIKPAWGEAIDIPRDQVQAVDQDPGWVLVDKVTPRSAGPTEVEISIPVGIGEGRLCLWANNTVEGEGLVQLIAESGMKSLATLPEARRISLTWSWDSREWICDANGLVIFQGRSDQGRPKSLVLKGAFQITQAATYRRSIVRRITHADARQDQVVTTKGDLIFGSILRVDKDGVDLVNRLGRVRFSWAQARQLSFRQSLKEMSAQGEIAWVQGCCSEPDVVIGRIRGLDAATLALEHDMLGSMRIEKARLIRLQPPPKAS